MLELLQKPMSDITTPVLSDFCSYLNTEYRQGNPVVSDDSFDLYLAELYSRSPDDELFSKPQPTSNAKGLITHPSPMLSTSKVYLSDDVTDFVARCFHAAGSIGIHADKVKFRVMAKLDGIAGRYVEKTKDIVTRGDGSVGSSAKHLLENGLQIIGDASYDGVGEVCMPQAYFDKNLCDTFAHPRNVIAGMAASQNYNEHAKQALSDGQVHLVLYRDMPCHLVSGTELIDSLDTLISDIKNTTPYPIDGTIIEVENKEVRDKLGSGSSYHHWQIAKKEASETVEVEITDETWQVSRNGRITPVFHFKDTKLSGAVITKISGKHARYVIDHGLGKGAKFLLTRSGLIIPNHIKTTKPVTPNLPTSCPCCGGEVTWLSNPTASVDTFIQCENIACSAQSERAIIHHFKKIKVDLFGEATVKKLANAEYTCIEQIYLMNESAFEAAGFGVGQSRNLVNELNRVVSEPLQDNLLLASLGISSLGRGSSEKLLAVYRIDELENITPDQIKQIDGFGDITSNSIALALKDRADTLKFLLNRNFNLVHTQDNLIDNKGGSLDGVTIVFTGSMSGNRNAMKTDAKSKGGTVQSSVNGRTMVLCCGSKVGQKKIDAARANNVEIISEDEYWTRYAS